MVLAEIGKLYAYVVPKVLDIEIDESTAATAIRDMKRVQSVTFDATGLKRKFLNAAETVIAPFSKNYFLQCFVQGTWKKQKNMVI